MLLALALGSCAVSEPLPSAPLALDTIPPVASQAVEPPRRVLVVVVDGFGSELCTDRSALPSGGALTGLLGSGCRPLVSGIAGVRGDRASLVTGVEPGSHGVFADSSVRFGVPRVGERHWPSGPRRALHAFRSLLDEGMPVVVVGAVDDYPPPRAPFLHFVAGAALPEEVGAGPVWELRDGQLLGGEQSVALTPGVVSAPIEFGLTRADGSVVQAWTRAVWDGGTSVVITPFSAHPLSPGYPLSWPPSAALDLWEAGVALRNVRGSPRGLRTSTGKVAAQARRAFARHEALETLRAAAVLIENERPALTIVHVPWSPDLVGGGDSWVAKLDGALADVIALAADTEVVLVSLRGRAVAGKALPDVALEEGLRWSGPGSVRAGAELPAARRRGALDRAAVALAAIPGVARVIRGADVPGSVAGLAPDLQIVAGPGYALRGDGRDTRDGFVAGASVGSGGGLSASRVGGWLPNLVQAASGMAP